jgi:hypothetical protein
MRWWNVFLGKSTHACQGNSYRSLIFELATNPPPVAAVTKGLR